MSAAQVPGTTATSNRTRRLKILGLGLITSVLWASTFVIVKIGLGYIGPLSMAAFRYSLAFLLLLPLALRVNSASNWRLPRKTWLQLALTGIAGYPLANGLLFWGLTVITPTTSSFLFNLTPFLVLLLGIIALREVPSASQWLGLAVVAGGIILFFALPLGQGQVSGLVATAGGALAFAWFTVQSRALAKTQQMGAVLLTALPLGIGGAVLLVVAFLVEGLPRWNPVALLVIFWLAAINTALANAIWMKALGSLQAFELSILMSLMPVETAIISWVAMGEQFTPNELGGIALVVAGVLLVQRAMTRRGVAEQRAAPAES